MNIPENFDRWMFDYKEGNLSGAEKEAFENFLVQHPQFEVEADAWDNAFIENETFEYPHAAELEKDNRVVGIYGWVSAAAIALLLIGTSVFFFDSNDAIEGISAQTNVEDPIAIQPNTTPAPHLVLNKIQSDQNLSALSVSPTVSLSTYTSAGDQHELNPEHGNSTTIDGGVTSANETNTDEQLYVANNGLSNVSGSNNAKKGDVNIPGATNPTVHKMAFDQEISKLEGEEHISKYQGNPEGKDLAFDVAQKAHYEWNFKNKMKRFWNKVEDAFDIPPSNLTNLGDPEILLPNSSILAFNPGFTGGINGTRFDINYRNQWLGSDNNSQMLTMSLDKYFSQVRGGVGIMVNAQDYGYGQFGDYNVSLMYSPKILLGKNVVVEPSVKLTLGALNANGNKLASDSQFELNRGRILQTPAAQQMNGQQQLWYKDYGLGLVVNTKKFYAGFSADNLNRHFENVYNSEGYATPTSSPIRINAIAGFDLDRKNSTKALSASPFVAYQQYGNQQHIWGGLNARFGWFTLGGSINQDLEFTAAMGMKFDRFKMVYHYDHLESTINNQRFGSHNLGIRFTPGNGNKPRNFKG